MSEMTEAQLVQRCRQGDRDAFNTLVERFQSKVVNIAYGMLSSQEDAYDAAQEVFIKVYRNIGSFQEKSSLSTWIYRITSNVCTDMLRKRTRTAASVSIQAGYGGEEESQLDLPDTTPTPHEQYAMTETQREVREAIASLSEEFRTVITLFDLEGMSYEEISAITDCPVGTVKSRLSRARKTLKKKLSEKRELFF